MRKSSQQTVCDICGKTGARIRHVSETHGKGKNLLVIENIPMVSCQNCGVSYFTAETLHEIERLKRQRRALAVERPVEILSYS